MQTYSFKGNGSWVIHHDLHFVQPSPLLAKKNPVLNEVSCLQGVEEFFKSTSYLHYYFILYETSPANSYLSSW